MWVSVPDACRVLGMSYTQVYRLLLTNALKSKKIGTRLLVHRGDVMKRARERKEAEATVAVR